MFGHICFFFQSSTVDFNVNLIQIKWHPRVQGVVAMTVVESTEYAEYLNNLSNRKFDNKDMIVT